MAKHWRSEPGDPTVAAVVPKPWFDALEIWVSQNLSSTASKGDGLRAILAKELGFPYPGETIKRNSEVQRQELNARAEQYIESHQELGSWAKVAIKFGKSPSTVRQTVAKFESKRKVAALISQRAEIEI